MEYDKLQDLDINQILQYHNCRYPCLMIDYMEEIIPGQSAKGYKNFTYNEWFFPAHFADDPNVPSSVLIEAMSQTLLMTFLTLPGYAQINTACLKIDHVEFKQKVIPGKRLDLSAQLTRFRGGGSRWSGRGENQWYTCMPSRFCYWYPENYYKVCTTPQRPFMIRGHDLGTGR